MCLYANTLVQIRAVWTKCFMVQNWKTSDRELFQQAALKRWFMVLYFLQVLHMSCHKLKRLQVKVVPEYLLELLFYLFEDQVWLKSINSCAERHSRNSAITGGKKRKTHLITFWTSSNYCKQANTTEKSHTDTTRGNPTKSKQNWLPEGEAAVSQPPPAHSCFRCAGRTCGKKVKHPDQPANSIATLCAKTETAQTPPQGLHGLLLVFFVVIK